jgi:hypothetical protein
MNRGNAGCQDSVAATQAPAVMSVMATAIGQEAFAEPIQSACSVWPKFRLGRGVPSSAAPSPAYRRHTHPDTAARANGPPMVPIRPIGPTEAARQSCTPAFATVIATDTDVPRPHRTIPVLTKPAGDIAWRCGAAVACRRSAVRQRITRPAAVSTPISMNGSGLTADPLTVPAKFQWSPTRSGSRDQAIAGTTIWVASSTAGTKPHTPVSTQALLFIAAPR